MTTASIAERATALLAALGDHEDQVAASLKARGITGERGHCGTCPIAVYLLRSDLGCYAVDVDGSIYLWFVGPDDIQHVEKISMPDPVNEFVCAFDTGRYDELLAGGGPRV
jgi:hypothetical protein